MKNISPYLNKEVSSWLDITKKLINEHPLKSDIVDICLKSWKSIVNTTINSYINLQMKNMNISPQSVGNLLHDVIPEYINLNTEDFRKGNPNEKDVVCKYNDLYSFEIKTSSQNSIFGNRSYALSENGKNKSGYYLAINFDKLIENNPSIKHIRFGWIDYSDWIAQKSQTGQQAKLDKNAENYKLITLYSYDKTKL
ncbi:ScaI family restriction endonuclease [Brachyspira pilosicoli]|uniref:ScaI family restriction endonuclease n=1 Tax=Brachyspira pilosicoli TaxID=52584 RepID=A0A5C8EPG7_BRAPL|nr:ScaI family restriction endonuclease [Brachyspira pilosicoli]TXJ39696.1 ScaI family restriction endonuclease [Brachyspira pilosicoli]